MHCFQSFFAVRVVILLTLSLVACAGPQMVMRASEFNEAISSSSNELLLLNAVRAAKRFPLYYTTFASAKGQPFVSGKSTVSMPFGPEAKQAHTFGSEVNYNSGFQTFDFNNANTTDLNISEIVTADEYNNFIDNDWPRELVDILMIQKFELKLTTVLAVEAEVQRTCGRARSGFSTRDSGREAALCNLIYADVGCQHDPLQVRYFNSGTNRCDFLSFQRFVRKLRLIGSRIESVKPPAAKEGKKKGKSEAPKIFMLTVPEALGKKEASSRVFFRSPEGITVYLGQLVASQTLSQNPFTPLIIVRTPSQLSDGRVAYTHVRLFYVTKELKPGEVAVVSVRHEGVDFHIPKPNYGADDEDRSLQTLALLNSLLRTRLDGAATRPAVAYISN